MRPTVQHIDLILPHCSLFAALVALLWSLFPTSSSAPWEYDRRVSTYMAASSLHILAYDKMDSCIAVLATASVSPSALTVISTVAWL